MKFQQVMAFFLTGATVLSMSTTALAADLPDNVDITVSTTQTADEQEKCHYLLKFHRMYLLVCGRAASQ